MREEESIKTINYRLLLNVTINEEPTTTAVEDHHKDEEVILVRAFITKPDLKVHTASFLC